MNRRDVLKGATAAAISCIGLAQSHAAEKRARGTRQTLAKAAAPAGSASCLGDDGKLAGRTLAQVRDQYRYDLFDDFLPFMDKYVVDHELGGFLCNTDRDGTHITTDKNSWYIGRGTWVYSYLYNELAREPKYLEVARKAAEFVLRKPPQGDELWPAEYDRQGKAIPPRGQNIAGKLVPVGKQVYGDLFIADGLTEYARATGKGQYWDTAKQIMLKCVRVYDQPGYDPRAPQVYIGPDAAEIKLNERAVPLRDSPQPARAVPGEPR